MADRTVLERLLEAGITQDRAMHHLSDRWVRVDGEIITDPAHLAEPPVQVELRFNLLFDESGN
ncbi:hypothetical protein [Pseudonocardia sp.]|uniref:hypothetical protein n=1 Tax=Pseudonocardia sp. TaxID=60912 RepID=UPI00260F6D80|nr:hypothetical protein [Pseudonocardia sp.]